MVKQFQCNNKQKTILNWNPKKSVLQSVNTTTVVLINQQLFCGGVGGSGHLCVCVFGVDRRGSRGDGE